MRCPDCQGSVEFIGDDTLVCVERCGWSEIPCEHGNVWADCHKCASKDYCGCCETEATVDGWWCERCFGHVLRTGRVEERTYFAQHGEDCPFQS